MPLYDVKVASPAQVTAANAKDAEAKAKKRSTWTAKKHPAPPPLPPPPTPPPPSSDFLAPQSGTSVIWHDDASADDPLPLYGAWVGARKDGKGGQFTGDYDMIAPGRLARKSSGGPNGAAYREITAVPGDINWSAVRDALGYNWHLSEDDGWPVWPKPGPTVLWHEGEYRMLHLWLRLGEVNHTGYFRQLVEVKQCEPYNDSGQKLGAFFELQQREGNWMAICQWTDTWVIPVTQQAGDWVPVSVEGLFTADPSRGWLKLKIGDRTSPVIRRQTLLRDSASEQPVPSFMELGPYQDAALPKFTLGTADVRVYG